MIFHGSGSKGRDFKRVGIPGADPAPHQTFLIGRKFPSLTPNRHSNLMKGAFSRHDKVGILLADAVAVARPVLLHIHMQMVGMGRIGSGAQHSGEPAAGGGA
jgi:hypothetical protein